MALTSTVELINFCSRHKLFVYANALWKYNSITKCSRIIYPIVSARDANAMLDAKENSHYEYDVMTEYASEKKSCKSTGTF